MDHSIQGYLARQSTERLIYLLDEYRKSDNEYDKSIYEMIYSVLEGRGILPDELGADL